MSQDEEPLVILVVRGHPTPDEIAALTVVLSSLRPGTGVAEPAPTRPGGWSSRRRALRTSVRPGPGAWRMSGRG